MDSRVESVFRGLCQILHFSPLLRDRAPGRSPLRKRSRHAVAHSKKGMLDGGVLAVDKYALRKGAFFLGFLSALVVVGGAIWAYIHHDELLAQGSVEHVVVKAPLIHVSAEQLEEQILPFTQAGFFGADLEALRRALEQQPWVWRAVVTRSWPATLNIQIKERTPIAYWGSDKMLDQNGVLFKPDELPQMRHLPMLQAPGQYSGWVMEQYHQMNGLLRTVGVHITDLQLNSHMSWRLSLNDGVVIKVDRHNTVDKLIQLVEMYPKLMAMEKPVQQVDLRYLKGFAVKWGLILDETSDKGSVGNS